MQICGPSSSFPYRIPICHRRCRRKITSSSKSEAMEGIPSPGRVLECDWFYLSPGVIQCFTSEAPPAILVKNGIDANEYQRCTFIPACVVWVVHLRLLAIFC